MASKPIPEFTGGGLAAQLAALSPAQRAAFTAAVRGTAGNVRTAADTTAMAALSNVVIGTYCRVGAGGSLYRLDALPSTTGGNWSGLLPAT